MFLLIGGFKMSGFLSILIYLVISNILIVIAFNFQLISKKLAKKVLKFNFIIVGLFIIFNFLIYLLYLFLYN